jgi:hypothetical protein
MSPIGNLARPLWFRMVERFLEGHAKLLNQGLT